MQHVKCIVRSGIKIILTCCLANLLINVDLGNWNTFIWSEALINECFYVVQIQMYGLIKVYIRDSSLLGYHHDHHAILTNHIFYADPYNVFDI